MERDLLRKLAVQNDTKLVLLVLDGLGGLPHPDTRRTELEQADIPHLDRLAAEGSCGLTIPVAWGVTPGSGPGHLALFGYDPLVHDVGRGVLEAVGIDFPVGPNDVCARGNFCTVDDQGLISDRRAGRIPTEESSVLVERLRTVRLPGVEIFVEPVREHRFVLVLRGEGLHDELDGTDPNREGAAPLPVRALTPKARATADLLNRFIEEARGLLAGEKRANMVLLRGFSRYPHLPSFRDDFKLRAAAIAVYPMYRGLARLCGFTSLPGGGAFADELQTLRDHWGEFDFFFVHYKKTDAAGEDGDFERKVHAIEELDAQLPQLLDLKPDVLVVAGDHATPSVMAAHSWHPVPYLLHSRTARADETEAFNEAQCRKGCLGIIPAVESMSLMLAHAGRLTKYGA